MEKFKKIYDNIISNRLNSNVKNYNTFPKGTNYEKELNTNFKYFNVFWYDPKKSNDFELFINCFKNVQFYKSDNFYSSINFFKKESIFEWIVVTPGSLGKELILNLENFQCIKAFFIYCQNPEIHEWAKKIKKVKCLTSDPEVLCKKFIELNKTYFCPNFNYIKKEDKDNSLHINEINSEYSFHSNSILKNPLIRNMNKIRNKYNNLCIHILNYLDRGDAMNDLKTTYNDDSNIIFKIISKTFNTVIPDTIMAQNLDFLELIILMSLYFNKYPYLCNYLSYDEVKYLFSEQIGPDTIYISQMAISPIIDELCEKILDNECILDERDKLKIVQIFLIRFINFNYSLSTQAYIIKKNYYQINNIFRDIDFCLKIYISINIPTITNKKYNFFNQITLVLTEDEHRYYLLQVYTNMFKGLNNFNEKDIDIINNTLKIKDFIVLGNNIFHEKMEIIEKNIKSKSFKYINIQQIENYLDEKKNDKNVDILTYFYFLIIRYEEYKENYEKFYLLSIKTGITFLIFLYIEKEDKLNKNIINILPTVLVYSPEDIINYLNQKLRFLNPFYNPNIEDLGEITNIKIPKITFEQNEEDKYQNGCFELAETFDVNLIRNNFVFRIFGKIDYNTEFYKHIYNIYKEHDALDLFYRQNCPYFGWILYPELGSFGICFVKRFLYMYCREEEESEKSFYRIINDDLRSREPLKIYRYINILALINDFIEKNYFANYKGVVYRATKLDEKLILKLVTGSKMVNTTFWSTSKDFKVAEKFMKMQKWRNVYIICKTIKNNIDIDLEKLNPFNEKEVLFLPFTEFIVEKVSSEEKFKKKIYIIKLKELGNRNFVNCENMQVEDIKNLNLNTIVENSLKNEIGYLKEDIENMKKGIFKNFK